MGDKLKEKNAFFCVSRRLTVSPSSCWRKGSTGLNWLSNSHRRAFTQAALSYFSWNINQWGGRMVVVGGETQLLLPFHVISVMLLWCPPTPTLIFYLHNEHRCPGSYYLYRVRSSKAINITGCYSFFLLIFNQTSSMFVSPEATEVEPHHLLLWTTTFLFLTCFSSAEVRRTQAKPTTIHLIQITAEGGTVMCRHAQRC